MNRSGCPGSRRSRSARFQPASLGQPVSRVWRQYQLSVDHGAGVARFGMKRNCLPRRQPRRSREAGSVAWETGGAGRRIRGRSRSSPLLRESRRCGILMGINGTVDRNPSEPCSGILVGQRRERHGIAGSSPAVLEIIPRIFDSLKITKTRKIIVAEDREVETIEATTEPTPQEIVPFGPQEEAWLETCT